MRRRGIVVVVLPAVESGLRGAVRIVFFLAGEIVDFVQAVGAVGVEQPLRHRLVHGGEALGRAADGEQAVLPDGALLAAVPGDGDAHHVGAVLGAGVQILLARGVEERRSCQHLTIRLAVPDAVAGIDEFKTLRARFQPRQELRRDLPQRHPGHRRLALHARHRFAQEGDNNE